MINQKVTDLLNDQLGKELFSSYLYLAISNYYTEQNLDGFANWFEIQAHEELDHAMLFRKFMLNAELPVSLGAIAAPTVQFTQTNHPLKAALAHEKMITASICSIYSEALDLKDFQTTQFLDWFIKEQGEEEKNSNDLIKKFELFGSDSKGLYMLNAELLARVYSPPSLVI